ncbi:MAG: phage protein Gp36 family protein [Blastocatellia bacterium]
MSYITTQDLIDELGEEKLLELTDDEGSGDLENDHVQKRIGKALSYAVGTFDSYARQRYQIPVPVTEKVKATCIDLAVFNLFKGRGTSATKESVYGVKKDAHDLAMKYLLDIGAGRAALDVPSIEETITKPASPDEVLRGSSKSQEVFSNDKLTGY